MNDLPTLKILQTEYQTGFDTGYSAGLAAGKAAGFAEGVEAAASWLAKEGEYRFSGLHASDLLRLALAAPPKVEDAT